MNETQSAANTGDPSPNNIGALWPDPLTQFTSYLVSNGFDPNKDYFGDLRTDEKWDEGGKEYPYLNGLKRIAFSNRGGVQSVRSDIVKVPSVNVDAKGMTPDCIAAVTVTYSFKDGTSFAGSADASYKAHKAPFSLHLVAIAESKAEARAIRRAFNISQVAKEEIGSSHEEEDRSNEKISDTQLEGIKNLARRKQLGQKDVLKLIKRDDLANISELTHAEAVATLKAVNSYKPKPKQVEVPATKEV
ncbi:hypothetical protein E4G67_00050 [Candidatus Bathyarchaeota archaeon]|nr:MAG: hypothetical protein E4G67_00050 [Candidatus Bathyarchaeota archaeon]